MFQLPAEYLELLSTASGIGTLAWLISTILALLIGPIGLMVGVRLFGSKDGYGKCFVTYFLVWLILLIFSLSALISAFLSTAIFMVIVLVMVIFICCIYPKMVSSRHELNSWFKGLIAIIIAAIVAAIINFALGFVVGYIPDIVLFII